MILCRRFEDTWQDRFDTGSAHLSPGSEPAWVDHLTACGTCRELDRRYRRLAHALVGIERRASELPVLTERVLAELPSRSRPSPTWRIALAVAAALLVALGLGSWLLRQVPRSGAPPFATVRPLADSVMSASAASVDLARAASEPAGRLSQELLASVLPESQVPDALAAPDLEPGRLIRGVSRRLDDGVRPLASSARRAFDFLIPGPARPGGPVHRGA